MKLHFSETIAERLQLSLKSVKNVLQMLEDGNTIPFIARYRKDRTSGMDELGIAAIQKMSLDLFEFSKRKEFILVTIKAQGQLDDKLKLQIENCKNIDELEDLYLPYKVRKKTKADLAREKGLEPLAKIIYNQKENNLYHVLKNFINYDVKNAEEALQGARDIIAEWVSEDAQIRLVLRERFKERGFLNAKVVKTKIDKAQKYKDYFNFSERIEKCPGHRIMAIFRGADEGLLRINLKPDDQETLELLNHKFVKFSNQSGQQLILALNESWKRLLQPSLETEFKNILKKKAEDEAIDIFAKNLRQLLLSEPLGPKRILAIDPGIKSGCKIVCLNQQGQLEAKDTLFIHLSQNQREDSKKKLQELLTKFNIEAIAIGDGTAGRETEQFVRSFVADIPIFLVNEDGASVYSVSEAARMEFPNEDVTVKGTVSIGRRLMDPLAELVKIDPKAIGVGQYQHDVTPSKLKSKLDQTVESCVNQIGVNVNTAGIHLLTYVSGLGPVLAQNIVEYRQQNGPFKNRMQLNKVPRLGAKAYEQCAGFLRIKDGDSPLDASAVHPENYFLVDKMSKELGLKIDQILGNEAVINKINTANYLTETIGEHTLKDILSELKKPGLDPRQEASAFKFSSSVFSINDLKIGMVLPGMVTNITAFGAFVDIGVKQDGLVHISQLANKFVKDASEVVYLQQKVLVKVLELDVSRKRISLSMKDI